jgi:3-dehydroquinate synthase
MDTIHVPLGKRAYDVLIGFDVLAGLGRALKERELARDNIAIFTSPAIGQHYYAPIEEGLRAAGFRHVQRWEVPDGEEAKSLESFVAAVRWLAHFTPDPSVRPLVVTLGGGVVGDLGGFAAACFRRGIPYVQAPTTLLAAVDSSIGGKTGVNLPEGKNLVGAIYQPALVYMDLATLKSLPERDVRSGLAEVIKYGAILDADLFQYLEEAIEELLALEPDALMRVVPTCVQLKADTVARDEMDREHVRVCLNFGHTIGHAIERAAEGRLNHGECVAIGMVAAARISVWTGLCQEEVLDRLEALIQRAGLPTHATRIAPDRVAELMAHDKKFLVGRNRFVLLTDIGQWAEREAVPSDVVRDATREALF